MNEVATNLGKGWRERPRNGNQIHHDNVSPHTVRLTTVYLSMSSVEIQGHPPYSRN